MKNTVKKNNKKKFFNTERLIRLRLFASFVLIGLASVIRGGEWIVFFALIPLITYLPHIPSMSATRVRRDFYWGGFIIGGFAYFFLFQMAPQNWTVILTGWFAIASRAIAWMLVSFFCAISFWVVGILLLRIKNFNQQLIALPFLWVLGEILRTYLYAVMAYGPGGSLSPNYNWGSLAVSAAGTPLVYASRLVGFYGLTVIAVLVNIALFLLVCKRKFSIGFGMLFAVAIVTWLGWWQGNRPKTNTIDVSIVHLSETDSLDIWDGIDWPAEKTDLLVLPEYSEFFKNVDKEKIAARLSENGLGVTTREVGSSPNATNQITYFNNRSNILNTQDKTFLIPTGEYIPYSLQVAFWLLAQKKVLQDFTYSQQITSGDHPEKTYISSGFTIGALACSGVTALNEYHRLTRQGADILVNTASLSFLKDNSFYNVYAQNMARYQAVSNNRPFVQASRSGESYIFDNQANVIAKYHGNNTSIINAQLSY